MPYLTNTFSQHYFHVPLVPLPRYLNIGVDVVHAAWTFLNDSFVSNQCTVVAPNLLASACLYLALEFHRRKRRKRIQFVSSGQHSCSVSEEPNVRAGINGSSSSSSGQHSCYVSGQHSARAGINGSSSSSSSSSSCSSSSSSSNSSSCSSSSISHSSLAKQAPSETLECFDETHGSRSILHQYQHQSHHHSRCQLAEDRHLPNTWWRMFAVCDAEIVHTAEWICRIIAEV